MEPLRLDLGENADYLYWLRQETENLRDAEEEQRRVAVACRELGCTWEEIGRACGISRQAAQQKYGR